MYSNGNIFQFFKTSLDLLTTSLDLLRLFVAQIIYKGEQLGVFEIEITL